MNYNNSTTAQGFAGFTAQGQHNLPATDLTGLIPCMLTGPTITRPTTLYINPQQLPAKIAKYAAMGQTLAGPSIRAAAEAPAPPERKRRAKRRRKAANELSLFES